MVILGLLVAVVVGLLGWEKKRCEFVHGHSFFREKKRDREKRDKRI